MIVPDSEYLDFSQVPQTKGIPKSILYSAIVGLAMIFGIGASVVLLSGNGHHWPAASSMRVDLGALHE
ncbi:MAG TPA: hypothetical protein VGF98_13095 [Candidatus Tumulicola sp.]|jgi:hypothetical protein